MVDYVPWNGNYTGTVVRNNSIYGGFATDTPEPGEVKGVNGEDALIKFVLSHLHLAFAYGSCRIGIAIGPRTW